MSLSELLLLIIVISGAAYAGYMFGRWSVLNERGERDASPLPERERGPLPGPREGLDPPRRPVAPPPAAAGDSEATQASAGGSRQAPSRTAAPPPARAGLLDAGAAAPDLGPKSTMPPDKQSKSRD